MATGPHRRLFKEIHNNYYDSHYVETMVATEKFALTYHIMASGQKKSLNLQKLHRQRHKIIFVHNIPFKSLGQ